MASTLARSFTQLPNEAYKLFKPSRFRGDLPEAWCNTKREVSVDGNPFYEINLNSDDPVLILRNSHIFHVRDTVYREARQAQKKLLQSLQKKEAIKPLPKSWVDYADVLRKGSQAQAEREYHILSRWKLRCDELRPEKEVYPHDYLFLSFAIRSKMGLVESVAAQYFPLPFVIKGIRELAQLLLGLKDPPKDPDWYLKLCPWLIPTQPTNGYPICLTPSQTFQLFRHAGSELARKVVKEKEDQPISPPLMYGYLFEYYAAEPAFCARYSNHWSRVSLNPTGPAYPLPSMPLLKRIHRTFPAFEVQQAWWYSQPDKLQDEALEDGVHFYPVPSARHTLMAGAPTMRNTLSRLAMGLVWHSFVDEDSDILDKAFIKELKEVIDSVDDDLDDAVKRVLDDLSRPGFAPLASEDITKLSIPNPCTLYDETYRPILGAEIEYATAEGIELPQWYRRRRAELMAPEAGFAHLLPDLEDTSQSFGFELPEEEAKEEGKAGEEEEVEERDASENEALPLIERLRMARMQRAIDLHDEEKMQQALKDKAVAESYEHEHQRLKMEGDAAKLAEGRARAASIQSGPES